MESSVCFFCLLRLCFAAASFYTCLFSSRLPGGGVTFFAAAKKVTKESSFFNQTLPLDAASGLTFVSVTIALSVEGLPGL
jgi:hypothetical protein